jgi:hypothetical protein
MNDSNWQDLEVVGFDGAGSAPCAAALPWVRSQSRNVYGMLSIKSNESPSWYPQDEFKQAVLARRVTPVVDRTDGSKTTKAIPGGIMVYCRREALELHSGRWPCNLGELPEWRLDDSLRVVYAAEPSVIQILARFVARAQEVLPGCLSALLKGQKAGRTLDPFVNKIEMIARTGLAASRGEMLGATAEKPQRCPRQEFYAYLGAANLIAGRVTATKNIYHYMAKFDFPGWSWEAYRDLITHDLIELAIAWSTSVAGKASKRGEGGLERKTPTPLLHWYSRLQSDQEDARWLSRDDDNPLPIRLMDSAARKAEHWRESLQIDDWGLSKIEQILSRLRERFRSDRHRPSISLTLRDALSLATHRSFWLHYDCFILDSDPPRRLRLTSPCLRVRVYDLREAEDKHGEAIDRLTTVSQVVTAP